MGQSLGLSQRHAGFQRGSPFCRAFVDNDSFYHPEHERYDYYSDHEYKHEPHYYSEYRFYFYHRYLYRFYINEYFHLH